MHFNSETEIYASVGSNTNNTKEHEVRDDEMVSFYNMTIKRTKKIHFQSKVIKFILGFYSNIWYKYFQDKKTKHFPPSVKKW